YKSGFLKNQLNRPQISIISLIKDIDSNNIIKIWELIDLSTVYKYYIVLLRDDIIVLDFYILEQIRDSRMHDTKVINKKIKYANEFGKIKKALNITLDLGCEKELIHMITCFINLIISTENNNNEIIKHCEQPPIKRLKSSSELQGHKGLVHNYQAMNPQDPNIRMPLSNINTNNNQSVNNNVEK
ncbi:35861_t:CDS:2, partial [Gigaspora margarita]